MPEAETWQVVRTFSNPMEARLALGMMEAQDMPCRLRDENLVSQDWLLSNAIGGVRMEVPAEHAESARAVLAGLDEEAAIERAAPPVCPLCGASDIETREASTLATLGWILLVVATGGLALLAVRPRHRCRKCSGRWG